MAGRGAKVVLVAVGGVALGVFLFYQHKQIRVARAQNEQLRAQAQAAEQAAAEAAARPPMVQTNTPTGPDPELLRLRAEVARLRGVEAELARARQQMAQTKAAVTVAPVQPPPPAVDPTIMAQHQDQVVRTVTVMKQLGLGLQLLARDQTAADKSVVQNGQLNPKLAQALATPENPTGVDLSNIEFLVADAGQLNNAAPEALVARTKPIPTPDGKWLRVYAIANGAAQQRLHQSPDEVWDGR